MNILFCIFFINPLIIFSQCFTSPYGQNPSTIQTVNTCNGSYQTLAKNCINGEYSKVNVTAGNTYSFKSSRTSDYITISDNNGTAAYATGGGMVTWTATLTTVVRFYTHANASCLSDKKRKRRLVSCTQALCASPGNVVASGITGTSATISWAAAYPAPANGYGYEIRTSGTGGSGSSGLISSGSTSAGITSVNISGLTASTVYTPYIRSNCGSSYSSYTTGSSFTTSAPTCAVASGLSTTNITSSSATFNWGAVSGATGYNIQYRKTSTTTWTSSSLTTTNVAVSGLTASTTYEFQVQTVCSGSATSAFSTSSTFTTSALICAVASGLSTTNITSSSATFNWDAVSGATGYNIRYRKTGTTTWTSSTSSTTSIAVSGLTASTAYEFQVQTICSGSATSAFSASSTFTTSAATVTNPVPAFSHIVIVLGENTNASAVFGSSSAPYINALAAVGAKFTNSYAIEHPSQPNYLDLYSGSNQGITDDSYITTKYTTANLGKELINAGKTYITYSEGLPSVGYDGSSSGLYVRKHNPAANWMGTGTNQIPTTTNQPFTAFPTNYNNLPSVSFVVPNMCNDGHDVCAPLNNSTLQYDTWIKNNLDAYKQWCVNNNSLLIVTYDEDDFTTTNKIATVFYGANVVQGAYSQTINHYSVLRTVEDAFRLSSHAGSAASASPIDFCWTANLVTSRYSTALEEENASENINIFPNPASNKINVMAEHIVSKNVSWEITNTSGSKLKSGNVTNISGGKKIDIETGDLKNGIYLLRILDGVNMRIKKFVIAR